MDNPSIRGTTRNVAVIRATPAQTAILKKEFAISDMPTPEQIKALSEQTTLPSKWIHNWFGRQRTKANKSKPKAAQNSYMESYSLDPTFTPQELLRIKREHADITPVSGSSPMAEATSVSDYATISVSSSGTLDASVASGPSRKKRGRPPQKKTSPARNLRSSKRTILPTPANLQATRVKVELIEFSGSLNSKQAEDDSDNRPALSRINPGNLTNMPMACSQLIPGVAPPKRSPIPALSKTVGSRTRNTRSSLSVDQPDSIYTLGDTSSEQGAAARNYSSQPRYARTQKLQKAAIPHGPVFHTQFQNNVPENFTSSRVLPPVSSHTYSTDHFAPGMSVPMPSLIVSDASPPMIPQSQLSNTTFYNGITPLAPTFDWGNHSPSSGNVAVSNHGVIPHAAFQSAQCLAESQSSAYPTDYNYPSQSEPTTSQLRSELLDTILLDALKDIINPSLAPLKYLTDILGGFKDEQGTFVRLLAHEERDNLLKCLLDENLVQNNPFQAAMALSLLSKLGFEWDY